MFICMYVHTRECMNSLFINDFELHIIEILFASKSPQAVMSQAYTRKVTGLKPVVSAVIILTEGFCISLQSVLTVTWILLQVTSLPLSLRSCTIYYLFSFQNSTSYEPC
jgi:hypothetical protein